MSNVRICLALCTGLLVVGSASAAPPETLFVEIAPPSAPNPRTQSTTWALGGAVRSRHSVSLDLEALNVPASGKSPSGLGVSRLSGQVLLVRTIGAGKPWRLRVQTVYEEAPGVISYTGQIEGDPTSLFTISVKDQEVVGKIHEANSVYLLSGSNGSYDLTEIDKTLLVQDPDHDANADADRRKSAKTSRPPAKTSSSGNVRLLYLYSPTVVARNGSPDLLAGNVIAETNASMHNSGVSLDNFVSLAGMVPLDTDFPGMSRSSVATQMGSRSGVFSGLNALMQNVGADLAFTMISADTVKCDSNNNCNTNRVGGATVNSFTPNNAIVVTDSYALGDLTAPHEIGHALGGQHQVGSGSIIPGAEHDARGLVHASGTWQTIMGGYNSGTTTNCPFRSLMFQPTCVRLAYWSNPNMGTGVVGESNMAGALNIQMATATS